VNGLREFQASQSAPLYLICWCPRLPPNRSASMAVGKYTLREHSLPCDCMRAGSVSSSEASIAASHVPPVSVDRFPKLEAAGDTGADDRQLCVSAWLWARRSPALHDRSSTAMRSITSSAVKRPRRARAAVTRGHRKQPTVIQVAALKRAGSCLAADGDSEASRIDHLSMRCRTRVGVLS